MDYDEVWKNVRPRPSIRLLEARSRFTCSSGGRAQYPNYYALTVLTAQFGLEHTHLIGIFGIGRLNNMYIDIYDYPMRITIISPYVYSYFDPEYGPTSGGAQRQQHLISKELTEKGHDVSFIVGDFGQPKQTSANGITLITGAPTDIDGPISMGIAGLRLLRAMQSSDADVFLVRGSPRLTTVTYLCAGILRKPLVFRLANDSDVDPDYLQTKYTTPVHRLYRRAMNGVADIIAQTKHQQEVLSREFGVGSHIVPNAYDLPESENTVAHTDREAILWVGTSEPNQKKPQRFLKLAEQIPDESFEMISRPSGTAEGYHDELRDAAENVPNLEFVGEVPPEQVHEYYRQAKILINTSDYEGFPNTFLEAWRYETPVISLHFGLEGILTNREAGLLSGDMDGLITDTKALAKDAEHRSRIGINGRQLVEEHYSLNRVAGDYESVLSSVVDIGGSP